MPRKNQLIVIACQIFYIGLREKRSTVIYFLCKSRKIKKQARNSLCPVFPENKIYKQKIPAKLEEFTALGDKSKLRPRFLIIIISR